MDSTFALAVAPIFALCWGSFLASFSFRIAFDKPLFAARSYCPACLSTIAWYDNIPLASWVLLQKQCRGCQNKISSIYPFIETVTALSLTYLFYKIFFMVPLTGTEMLSHAPSFILHALFFSALIGSTATDLFAMVIPQCFSVWLIPIGVLASFTTMLPIDHIESIVGSMVGYGVLWVIAFGFKRYTGKDGLGHGDMEQFGMIGAFTGPVGVWITLMLGSCIGLVIGGTYLYFSGKSKQTHIPFGPFLAGGAIAYVLFSEQLVHFFLF